MAFRARPCRLGIAITMLRSFKDSCQALRRSRPGRRFQDHYERTRRGRDGRSAWARIVRLTLATVAFAIGLVLTVLPGPAVLFFLVAGTLVAADSLAVARFLDRGELSLRAAWDRFRKKRGPKPPAADC